MYALVYRDTNEWVTSESGARMIYSSWQMASVAQRILAKHHSKALKVVEA